MLRIHKDRVRLPPLEGSWKIVGSEEATVPATKPSRPHILPQTTKPEPNKKDQQWLKSDILLVKPLSRSLGVGNKDKRTIAFEQNPQRPTEFSDPEPRDTFTSRTVKGSTYEAAPYDVTLPEVVPHPRIMGDVDVLRSAGWVMPTSEKTVADHAAKLAPRRVNLATVPRQTHTSGNIVEPMDKKSSKSSKSSLKSSAKSDKLSKDNRTETRKFSSRRQSSEQNPLNSEKSSYDSSSSQGSSSRKYYAAADIKNIIADNRRQSHIEKRKESARRSTVRFLERRSVADDNNDTNVNDMLKEIHDKIRKPPSIPDNVRRSSSIRKASQNWNTLKATAKASADSDMIYLTDRMSKVLVVQSSAGNVPKLIKRESIKHYGGHQNDNDLT